MKTTAAVALALALAPIPSLVGCDKVPPEKVAGSSVRIELPASLGSGVYIGNGLIITAAHVVWFKQTVSVAGGSDSPDIELPQPVKIISDNGSEQGGVVLWVNKTYDIAVIRPDDPSRYVAATLACRDPVVGEDIVGEGNPDGIAFLRFKGWVAGAPREFLPNWKSAYVVNMTISSGMSGGPSYDQFGEVIGINVGVADPHGEQGKPSTGGMGFTVPSSVVCSLLGRA